MDNLEPMLRTQNKSNYLIIVPFVLYLLIGVFIYQDYGISWDESSSRKNGLISAVYINKILKVISLKGLKNHAVEYSEIPDLHDRKNRDYGVLFEVFLVGAEYLFKLKDSKQIFQARHFFTFLVFWISVVYFYFLIQNIFEDRVYGLIGCICLVLSPRIFAHSFYNSKDLVFLAVSIIATYTLFQYLRQLSVVWTLMHGLATAALVSIRIVGIYIFAVTLLFYAIQFIKRDRSVTKLIRYLISIVIYLRHTHRNTETHTETNRDTHNERDTQWDRGTDTHALRDKHTH